MKEPDSHKAAKSAERSQCSPGCATDVDPGWDLDTCRSVYVHLPFCRHRCGYCNFSVVAGRDHLVERFLAALETEITQAMSGRPRLQLKTLFFGGGTPSHLNAKQLQRLKAIVDRAFTFDDQAEVTAECNPNDLDAGKLEALVTLGVNRISMGVQSLNATKLKLLERDHAALDVARAVELSRKFVDSTSIDLIFAAPGESLQDWICDLDSAISLQPDHLSTYELTFEKGTQFWNRRQRGVLSESDEDLRADMYEHTMRRLAEAGWEQYELSSFAKPGHRCRHNQVYWSGDDYLAFGPGASRFIGGGRATNHQSTMRYMGLLESGLAPVADVEQLIGLEAARERLVIGLRQTDGVLLDPSLWRALTTSLDELIRHGLLELVSGDGNRLEDAQIAELQGRGFNSADVNVPAPEWNGSLICRLTARGIMLSDGVAAKILR